jgi:hypothetical protein
VPINVSDRLDLTRAQESYKQTVVVMNAVSRSQGEVNVAESEASATGHKSVFSASKNHPDD